MTSCSNNNGDGQQAEKPLNKRSNIQQRLTEEIHLKLESSTIQETR
jgi:hypothetical protein